MSLRLSLRPSRCAGVGLVAFVLALSGLYVLGGPVGANTAGTGLVISEVYGGGGNSGAVYNRDFVELYNPTTTAIDVSTMSVQYRSASGTSDPTGVVALSGSVPGQGHYLVGLASGGSTGATLPVAPDVDNTSVNLSGTSGTVFLANQTGALTAPPTGSIVGNAAIADLVGYGTSNTFETADGPTTASAAQSIARNSAGSDTDHNDADFTAGTPSPQASGGGAPPPGDCGTKTIAEIQGTSDTSPCNNDTVTTTGVVTAAWPTGGFNGFEIQTGGTDTTPGASDAIFVYGQQPGSAIGSTVTVAGTVSEYAGQTEITASSVAPAAQAQDPVVVRTDPVPGTNCAQGSCAVGAALDALREPYEGELYQPAGPYTVTDPYDGSPATPSAAYPPPSGSSSNYGEIGLAAELGHPLLAPTEVYDTQTQATQLSDLRAYDAAHDMILDDGSSANLSSNPDVPFPWLTLTHTVRDGAAVTFRQPFVLSYRNSEWTLEPQAQITGDGESQVDIAQDRPAAPANVGGNVRLATFNVLNYFPTTGEEFASQPGHTCTYYDDRAGNHITDKQCDPNGPRGAADAASLQRQQDKIVHAINHLGADIVSLEEIENSVQFGKDRDFGVQTLVNALNADAGAGTWSYAPSPPASGLPPTVDQDVIRTAFIYKPATVALVGASQVLTGSAAFTNAREPLAQAFKRVGAPDGAAFAVIVNHFKSKGDDGSNPATGDNVDAGQGYYNGDRVRQADAMTAFADQFKASRGVSAVFLTGDYNAYSQEDPVQEIESKGYTDLGGRFDPGDKSYNFGGQDGSLDHVFANAAALALVHGADIWQINANEPVYYEYSRYNYNARPLYDTSPYRASDHNPEVVGLTPKAAPTVSVKVRPKHLRVGHRVKLKIRVTASGTTPTGTVTVHIRGRKDRTATLDSAGRATLKLKALKHPGRVRLVVTYSGDARVAGSVTVVKVRVRPHRHHHRRHHGHGGGH